MRSKRNVLTPLLATLMLGCSPAQQSSFETGNAKQADSEPQTQKAISEMPERPVVYQMMTRLFGNTNTTNKPWGTIEENGVGKFAHINQAALQGIKEMGATHVWYTGVPHHAVIRDYTEYGISNDDPDVVKGRAGSPYAVKDYYNVNPDLASDPANRLAEFEQLIARTHAQGLKVVIDIVPNHVARHYQSLSAPEGVEDFGVSDNTSVEYARSNNFYYIPGQAFEVPDGEPPLGGEAHPLADGQFDESPAKWTGNGSRAAKPNAGDWYETVKINFGVKPDGSYDFPALPASYAERSCADHRAFWADKDLPDSWYKFRDIALYWTDKGVDGFRYDMAQMVPVEFWSFLNCSVKEVNPDAFLLSEIYIPEQYRNYIRLGKMDYLYDKVGTYDALRAVVEGKTSTDTLPPVFAEIADIHGNLLMFLENHDEQRIASPQFAGDANKAKPAMVVSSTVASGANMIYFGQEVGEPGAEDAGFGKASRTTIFDYWGVPEHQRWMNGGKFDGGQLSDEQRQLRDFYARLLNLASTEPAFQGEMADLHQANREQPGYSGNLYSFARFNGEERILVIANFDQQGKEFELVVPAGVTAAMALTNGEYLLQDRLYGKYQGKLKVDKGKGSTMIQLGPLDSLVLKIR
ncbi:alpha-amylase family protein [Lacimicrobium alkaliphilum]|uniref:Alpha-amylase n=1 Tax=Lacimicrobium alkaliphilum TaxID=1526571 RepID=A0A0U2ZMU1_9ALTE|nr:alpha-amylase family protein [Lacimicrobium alkaliphilum]ALT00312.1 alpha-amylase [Lacimicrobium alkaliphilum]